MSGGALVNRRGPRPRPRDRAGTRLRAATLVRLFDASPRIALRLLPLVLADARRKQRAFKRKLARLEE